MRILQALLRAIRTTTFVTLCLSFALPLGAQSQKAEKRSRGEQAIEAIIARLPEAVLKREVDTLASILTDSVEVTIYGRSAKGKENIRSLLNAGLTRFIDVKVQTKTHEMKVGETYAAQTGYFKYTIEWPMGGTTVRDGDFTAKWELLKGNWLLYSLVVDEPKPIESTPEDQ